MAEVKWIKLTTSMFDDEKIKLIEAMPEADTLLIIWIKLLVLAGKTNANGYIYLAENIPYTDEMLATLFNRPLNTVRLALKTFAQFGMIKVFDNNLIFITNWEKHQNIAGLDKIREQTRQRVQKYRERKKLIEQQAKEELGICNVTVTLRNALEEDIEEEIDIDKDIEEDNKEPPVPYEKIKDLYNSICKSFSKIRSISSTRKKHLKARWKQFNYDITVFEEAFKKIEASDFCKGKNNRGWKADFDWLIKNDNNMVKVLEGKYDNGGVKDGSYRKEAAKHSKFDKSKFLYQG